MSSSFKSYIDQFRVSAGLAPDDRVLSEALLSEDKETNEMERVLMAALESAAKSRGKENWGRHTIEWSETDSAGDPESGGRYSEWEVEASMEVPVAAARPTVVRRKDGSFAVVVYMFAAPKAAGKVERNMGALAAASKVGLSKKLVESWTLKSEPPINPPEYYSGYGSDADTKEYEYGNNYGLVNDAEDKLEEFFGYLLPNEIVPDLIEKAFPQMEMDFIDSKSGGREPNHYCWTVASLKPKK